MKVVALCMLLCAGLSAREVALPSLAVSAVGTPFLIVALLIPQIARAHEAAALKLTEQEERDSYAIYSTLLKQDESRVHSPILGIQQETLIFQPLGEGKSYPVWPVPAPNQQRIYQPLIEDFQRRNAQPLLLRRRFDLPTYRLVTAREADAVARRHPPVPPPPGTKWSTEQDPSLNDIGVVFFLSAVGFSPDHRRALVHIATSYGGQYYFLVKRRGKWIIDREYCGDVHSWVA